MSRTLSICLAFLMIQWGGSALLAGEQDLLNWMVDRLLEPPKEPETKRDSGIPKRLVLGFHFPETEEQDEGMPATGEGDGRFAAEEALPPPNQPSRDRLGEEIEKLIAVEEQVKRKLRERADDDERPSVINLRPPFIGYSTPSPYWYDPPVPFGWVDENNVYHPAGGGPGWWTLWPQGEGIAPSGMSWNWSRDWSGNDGFAFHLTQPWGAFNVHAGQKSSSQPRGKHGTSFRASFNAFDPAVDLGRDLPDAAHRRAVYPSGWIPSWDRSTAPWTPPVVPQGQVLNATGDDGASYRISRNGDIVYTVRSNPDGSQASVYMYNLKTQTSNTYLVSPGSTAYVPSYTPSTSGQTEAHREVQRPNRP